MSQSGLDSDAADVLIRNYWSSSTNSGLDSVWSQWLRYCDDSGTDFSSPSIGAFVNFLQAVSSGTYRGGGLAGVATSAGWVRTVRSGVSSMLALMTATPRLGEHPLVTAFISSLIKQDVLERGKPGVRYDDTWDATLIFDYWMDQPEDADLVFPDLLDKAISLAWIHLCSRSSDLATLWFGSRPGGETVHFTVDGAGHATSVSVRYFNPKTGRYLANAHGFTSWLEFPVDDSCPAKVALAPVLLALRDRALARGSLHVSPSVFVSTRRFGSLVAGVRTYFYEGLSADRLATRMSAVMLLAGVPADFKAHSARSAGGALQKARGQSDDDIMDLMRLRSKYIYRKHYKRGARPVATMRHPVAVAATTSSVLASPDRTSSDRPIQVGSQDPSFSPADTAAACGGLLLVSPVQLSPPRPSRSSLGSRRPSAAQQQRVTATSPPSADVIAAAASAARSSR